MVEIIDAVFAQEMSQGTDGNPRPAKVFSEGYADKFPSINNKVPIVITCRINHKSSEDVSIVGGKMFDAKGNSIGGGFDLKLSMPEGEAGEVVMDAVLQAAIPDVAFPSPGQYHCDLTINGAVAKTIPLTMRMSAKT